MGKKRNADRSAQRQVIREYYDELHRYTWQRLFDSFIDEIKGIIYHKPPADVAKTRYVKNKTPARLRKNQRSDRRQPA